MNHEYASNSSNSVPAVAFFVSPHGFGHAARASAVAEALATLDKHIRIEIFTSVPQWFFETSLTRRFTRRPLETDIGLVQHDPLHIDLEATVERLNRFFPPAGNLLADTAETIMESNCRLIVCDIAPLGIAAAQLSGVPSVLIENFTWDWIYAAYADRVPGFIPHIKYLENLFSRADYHIQAEPVCRSVNADLTIQPVSRKPRTPAHEVRRRLGVPDGVKLVMASMGGIPADYPFIDSAKAVENVHFIFPCADNSLDPGGATTGNITMLPHHSEFYHPDLVNACDLVAGKVGYSTLSEVYNTGTVYGYILRPGFRESGPLEEFIRSSVSGAPIAESEFVSGQWLNRLDSFFATPPGRPRIQTGADAAAKFLHRILSENL